MKIPQINTKRFYFLGKWCFFIMAVMTLAGWIDSLKILGGLDIVKGFASLIFSFALFGFFSWMYGKEVKNSPNLNDDDLKALSGIIDTADLKKNKKNK